MALTEESARVRGDALKRLHKATREKWDPEAASIYVQGTAQFPTEVFVLACRRLETTAEWYPKLAELCDECRLVFKHMQDKRQQAKRRQLDVAPVSDEQIRDIRRRVQEALQRMRMR